MVEGARRKRPGRRAPAPRGADGGFVGIPGWLPPALYGLLTLFLFREFVFSDRMLYGSDTLSLGYMSRAFYADALASGVFPRWNPIILGGTPFLESLAGGDALYPTSLLLLVMAPYRALGWKLVLHVFLAGLLMFGWVRTLGRSRAAALLAGLAYGFAPVLVSFVHPGHDGKLFVASLTPLLFWVTERTFATGRTRAYVAHALVVGLVLLTTHFQMAYYLFGAVGVYALFRSVQLWKGEGPSRVGAVGRRLGAFLVASVVGAGVAGVQLVPAMTYVTEHSRRTATTTRAGQEDNVAYSSSWSLHPEEAAGLIVPEFAGNAAGGAAWADGTYWGRNFFKDNHEYAGLVVLILSGLSFFGAPDRGLRSFFAGLGSVALLYALGQHTPVWRAFYEVVPGLDLFRVPQVVMFLFGFSAATLAAFGVDRALESASGTADDGAGVRRYPWAVVGALALLFGMAASGVLLSAWTSTVYAGIDPGAALALDRATPFIVQGFLLAVTMAAATAGTLWAGRRGLLKPSGVVAVLALLLALDAVRVDRAFIETVDFDAWSAPDANLEFLLRRKAADDDPFRVLSFANGGQDVRAGQFGLELAAGHHPNDLARYRELIGMRGSGQPENLTVPNVYRLLNVRYLLWPTYQLGPIQGLEPVSSTQVRGQIYEAIYELPGLPRARLVAQAVLASDATAVATILDPDFEPATTAVLSEDPPLELGGDVAEGEVVWEERGINRRRLRVRTDRPALLVIADNWFPSWRARVDGEEASLLRAYHTLQAVPLTTGEHVVEIDYDSPVLRSSLALSFASLTLVFGVGLGSLVRGRLRARVGAET